MRLSLIIAVCLGTNFIFPLKVVSHSNSEIFISKKSDEDTQRQIQEIKRFIEQGQQLYNQRKYDEAILLFQKALAIAQETWGEKHYYTATSLNHLGNCYFQQGKYNEAETSYLQSLAIRKEILGEKHPDTATSLNNLAFLYKTQGKYKQAETLYLQSLAIKKEVLGEKNLSTANTLSNLASLYQSQGNYKQAESLYLQCLAIRKEILGENHPDTATTLDNLAFVYFRQGDYRQAESLYLQALAIRKEILGENHPSTAISLNNLALLYDTQGNFKEAETLYLQSLAIRKEILGEKHPSTANSLDHLGGLYFHLGNYEQAESLYLQALAIRKEVLGENHPSTANSLNNLALLYKTQGNYKKAEIFYLQSLAIIKEISGEESLSTATPINNLALLYKTQGNYQQAQSLYLQSLAIWEKVFGDKHPLIAVSYNNLSGLYWAQDNFPLAMDYLTQATDIEEYRLTEFLQNIGDESRKQAYIKTLSPTTNATLSLHLHFQPNNTQASQLALTTILRRKGRVLDALSNIVAVLQKNSNPQTEVLFKNLAQKRSELSSLIYEGKGQNTSEVYKNLITALETEIKDIETNLSIQSAEFRTINQPITLSAVQKAIPQDTVLVEYMVYTPINPQTNKSDKPHYAVYILHPDRTPQGIDLGETEKIDDLILKFRNNLASGFPADFDELQKNAQELYSVIFEPLLPLFEGKKNLFISPDSQLNLIPFAALQNRQGKYLVEDYSINYLSSGRDLLRFESRFAPQSPTVIVANPSYDLDIETSLTANTTDNRGQKRAWDLRNLSCCNSLPGTKAEAQAIIPLLSNPVVYTENQALVENVMKIKAPKILHLATHGFFLPDMETGTASGFADTFDNNANIENPLVRSGLAFAGFNPSNNKMNGVLTALDASSLYLWGTKLVVLSACQTGLGDVRNGEGVFGLRRGFVLAGAQSQLMSLWSVDDEATKELMSNYYQKLTQGGGRADALRQVQLEMLNSEQYQNPFYWAAFIPSGDWRSLDF